MLIASALCIYLILYFLLPSYYYKYKKNTIEAGLDKLVTTVSTLSLKESKKYLDEFNTKYTVSLNIQDKMGRPIYLPFNIIGAIPEYNSSAILDKSSISMAQIGGTFISGKSPSAYIVSKEIKFLGDNEVYLLNCFVTLQPIDEASKVLLNLVPLIAVVILIISVAGALIYSKIITKPLLKINSTAKSLAALDFKNSCEVKSNDEIGEIALSLNELASNLERTMKELKETNLKLLDDIEIEREMERKRREFTATISHELKTPITIIKGQLEGMLQNIGVYKDRDKYMNRSLTVLQDMESMVREILEISKLESHDFKPQYSEINLSYLINSCIENLSYVANEKSIVLNRKIAEGIFIQADEKLIKKAITNIINNAINHSPNSEQVFISLHKENHRAHLTVENTGVHIDEGEFEKIFNPFYRIEKSRNRSTGGSGLGLYIVKSILESHKLCHEMYNTDKGICFKIVF